MTILKIHLKILRFVRRRHSVKISVLDKKFGHDRVRDLLFSKYLVCEKDLRSINDWGARTGEFPPDTMIKLSDSGFAEVEGRDWLNLELIVRSFLFPIAVSVATTLITLFLKGVL